jgi:hypothetical protein
VGEHVPPGTCLCSAQKDADNAIVVVAATVVATIVAIAIAMARGAVRRWAEQEAEQRGDAGVEDAESE